MKYSQPEKADHLLYKTYWSLMLGDICWYLKIEPTEKARELIHEYNKVVLGYESISGLSHEELSRFLQEVCLLWAEKGLFVRTSKKHPKNIHKMDLADVWDLL